MFEIVVITAVIGLIAYKKIKPEGFGFYLAYVIGIVLLSFVLFKSGWVF